MPHHEPTEPDSDSLSKFEYWVLYIVEFIVLKSRYLLVPLYCALVHGIMLMIGDFYMTIRNSGEAHLTNHTMEVMQMLDNTLIASLVWLFSAGSFYIYIQRFPYVSKQAVPRVLTHISTGILKEKMAGSMVGISSVHLLQVFLEVTTIPPSEVPVRIPAYGVQIGIHLMLIVGLLAFSHTNKADHQGHNVLEDAKKEGNAHA